MLRENNKILRNVQLVSDLAITVLSFFVAGYFRSYVEEFLLPMGPLSQYLVLLYIILPLWGFLLYYNGAYMSIRTNSFLHTLWPVIKVAFQGGIILMTLLFLFKLPGISRALILLFVIFNALLLSVGRTFIYIFLHYIRKKGRNFRTVLIAGTGKRAIDFVEDIAKHPEWGIRVMGFTDKDASIVGQMVSGKKVLCHLDDIKDVLSRKQVDEVVFVVPKSWLHDMEQAILSCEEIGVRVRIVCDFYMTKLYKYQLDQLAGWPLLSLSPPPHYGDLVVVKRVFDFAFSAVVLVFTSPLLLTAAAGIKLTSSGPVFFRQERCGLNGRTFKLLKFRTMVVDAEEIKSKMEHLNEMDGPVFKIQKDPRITSIGRFLRKFSIDEFPQFINVLKGDMSVVGPRPPIPDEVDKYDYYQRRRLSVHPGLTCIWQISGRNEVSDFKKWVMLDLEYIDNWSFSLDMKIILKTVPAVLKGSGV